MPLETTLTAFFRKYFIAISPSTPNNVKVKPIEDFYLVKITSPPDSSKSYIP
jgi:hypothetical protein